MNAVRWEKDKNQKLNIPQQILDDSAEYLNDNNEVLGFITDKYEITHNTDDKIQASVLLQEFKYITNSKMTNSKFNNEVKNMGVQHKKETRRIGTDHNKMFFYGIKKRIDE